MVFRLEETLESLLAEIEVEYTLSEQVQWVSSAGSEDMTWMVEIGWPLVEAIGNAAYHGNGNYGNEHIILTRHQGKNGVVYAVQDQGSGFDMQRVVRQLRNGEIYYKHRGVGMRLFEHSSMVVTFNDCGNQIIFQYLL